MALINLCFFLTGLMLFYITIYDAYTKKILNVFNLIVFLNSAIFFLTLLPRKSVIINFLVWFFLIAIIWLTVGKYLLSSGDFKLMLATMPILAIINRHELFLFWVLIIWVVHTLIAATYQYLMKKSIEVPFAYAIFISFVFSLIGLTLY